MNTVREISSEKRHGFPRRVRTRSLNRGAPSNARFHTRP